LTSSFYEKVPLEVFHFLLEQIVSKNILPKIFWRGEKRKYQFLVVGKLEILNPLFAPPALFELGGLTLL